MQKTAAALKAAPPNDEVRSTLILAKDAAEWLEQVYAAKQAIDPAVKLAAAQAGTVVTSEQIRHALEPAAAIETEDLPEALRLLISRTQALLNSVEGVDGGLGNVVRSVTLPRDSATVVIDAAIPRRNLIDTFELTLTRRAADQPQQIKETESAAGSAPEDTAKILRQFELKRGERRIGSLSFLQQDNADSEQGSALRLELKISKQAEAGDLDRLEITLRGPLFRRVYRLQSE